MEDIKKLSNEALVKKIIVNSVKAGRSGMVIIEGNDTLAFDHHHPLIGIAKELNEAKDETLLRLNRNK